jgi:2-polyprenyl-3-methyl-5-hydroxy-6-metoxy-1,4-benzoquinol methylase
LENPVSNRKSDQQGPTDQGPTDNMLVQLKPFLSNERFTNSLRLQLPPQKNLYRLELLADLVKGKKIIHLGCADHQVDTIRHKLEKGLWLHHILDSSSTRCLGLDISREAVDFMRHELGCRDVFCHDLSQSPLPELASEKWDYIVFGEILEHVPNPSFFLQAIFSNAVPHATRLLITAPNALRLINQVFGNQCIEIVNSDHYYWFTPYTLMKVLTASGCEIDNFWMCESFRPAPQQIAENRQYFETIEKNALLRDTIVLQASIMKT